MLLTVKNIGMIKDAEVELNGITVIAGVNNTGKSTFGKVLYSFFNAFHNADKKIADEKVSSIEREVGIFTSSHLNGKYSTRLSKELSAEIMGLSSKLPLEELKNKIHRVLLESVSTDPSKEIDLALLELVVERIMRGFSVDQREVQTLIINKYIRDEFDGQITNINADNQGWASLSIKGKNVLLDIRDDACVSYLAEVNIRHLATYIDSPLVIDSLQQGIPQGYGHQDDLLRKLSNRRSDIIYEAADMKDAAHILSKLSNVVDGDLVREQRELVFKGKKNKKTIRIYNLSTGLKAMVIMKLLLENGQIQHRDVLILDEPEIHLHPEWQLEFAELLVMMQKEYELTILLNTHSPYFLRSIEVFSMQYGIGEKCKYYLASNKKGNTLIEDVTEKTNQIYKKLSKPFHILDDIMDQVDIDDE